MNKMFSMIRLMTFVGLFSTTAFAGTAHAWTVNQANYDLKMSEVRKAESVPQLPKNCRADSVTLIQTTYELEAAGDLQPNVLAVSYFKDDGFQTKLFDLSNSHQGATVKAGPHGVIITIPHENCEVPNRGAELEMRTYEISYSQLCRSPESLKSLELEFLNKKTIGSCKR